MQSRVQRHSVRYRDMQLGLLRRAASQAQILNRSRALSYRVGSRLHISFPHSERV